MDILQPQADLQPLVGSQKCCLQPEMDSLSVPCKGMGETRRTSSIPASWISCQKKHWAIVPFLKSQSGWKPLKSLSLGLLKHIIKVDPSINLLHCRIHLGQKSSKIQKRLTNVCHLHISLSQFVIMLAQKNKLSSHLLPPSRHFRRHFPPETNTTVKFCVFDRPGD